MITTNLETSQVFTVQVRQLKNNIIEARITNQKGQWQVYEFNRAKLALFTMTNGAVRDVVDFLLGDA